MTRLTSLVSDMINQIDKGLQNAIFEIGEQQLWKNKPMAEVSNPIARLTNPRYGFEDRIFNDVQPHHWGLMVLP